MKVTEPKGRTKETAQNVEQRETEIKDMKEKWDLSYIQKEVQKETEKWDSVWEFSRTKEKHELSEWTSTPCPEQNEYINPYLYIS